MARAIVPADISEQALLACAVIARHLGGTLIGIHLFGSAVDCGLKSRSDIDLLVIVRTRLEESARRALMLDLLTISVPPGSDGRWRALEVTLVARDEVVPWRYPARREIQFGEWLRADLQAGIVEPPVFDHDLAILLTKARQHGVALVGPPTAALLDAVPAQDFNRALRDTVAQWNTEADWQDDERNVVLALARIWYSAVTGKIAPKDVAATWVLERVPEAFRPVLIAARAGYLDGGPETALADAGQMAAFIRFARAAIEEILVA
ncbi:aminoglycoside adenylyltransferase family protein [Cupriavidus pauculus]|uniref:Aminoglycoside (3'') (9) adenylyltransferase n=1 Tax=Cupriavidus pauculus TaxID=82633 RepID=A0A2N5CA14_9BURK|nr:aminoglycoside adenylyltransferase family protein [Cupriavidus pauculus]PLP99046.1 aminoglycoside resistance protein [Cupriavidus pauculus]